MSEIVLDASALHGLSLSKAVDALGVSRRMIAYYSNGEKKVPKPILLACRGWDVRNNGDSALIAVRLTNYWREAHGSSRASCLAVTHTL